MTASDRRSAKILTERAPSSGLAPRLFLRACAVADDEVLGEGAAGHVDVPGIALDQPDAGQQENLPDRLRNDSIGDELAEAFVRPEARMQIGCAAADAKSSIVIRLFSASSACGWTVSSPMAT